MKYCNANCGSILLVWIPSLSTYIDLMIKSRFDIFHASFFFCRMTLFLFSFLGISTVRFDLVTTRKRRNRFSVGWWFGGWRRNLRLSKAARNLFTRHHFPYSPGKWFDECLLSILRTASPSPTTWSWYCSFNGRVPAFFKRIVTDSCHHSCGWRQSSGFESFNWVMGS